MLRQGADPMLAAELATELLWQSPWPFFPDTLQRLPTVEAATWSESEGGLGIRITRDGIAVGAADPLLPPTAVETAIDVVQPQLVARAARHEPARLIIVADSDVPVATVSSLADAAVARGATDVLAMANLPQGPVFIPLLSSRGSDQSVVHDVCVDATTVWSSSWRFIPGGLLGSAATKWQRVVDTTRVLVDRDHELAEVTVMSSVALPRLLTAMATIDGAREFPWDRRGVTRIVHGRDADAHASCEAWLAVLEAADVDAAALRAQWLRCDIGSPPRTRRQRRAAAACMQDSCERARDHVTRFASVPDIVDRRADAALLCQRAASSRR
jgi:hypothetical protein